MVYFMSQRMNGKSDISVLGTNQLKSLYKAYKNTHTVILLFREDEKQSHQCKHMKRQQIHLATKMSFLDLYTFVLL